MKDDENLYMFPLQLKIMTIMFIISAVMVALLASWYIRHDKSITPIAMYEAGQTGTSFVTGEKLQILKVDCKTSRGLCDYYVRLEHHKRHNYKFESTTVHMGKVWLSEIEIHARSAESIRRSQDNEER